MSATEDVAVEMGNRFAAVGSVVDHQPEAGFTDSQLSCNFRRLEEQMADQLFVLGRGFGDARYRFFGNDQNVLGRLRVDVAKGDHQIIFVNDVRGDFARGDLFKKRLAHVAG